MSLMDENPYDLPLDEPELLRALLPELPAEVVDWLIEHKDALTRLARQAAMRVTWPAYEIEEFIWQLPMLRDHQPLLLGIDWTKRWGRLVSKAMHANEQRAIEATKTLLGR